MKARKLKIRIESSKEFFDRFKENWKLLASGKDTSQEEEYVLSFPDTGMLSKILSRERLRIIQVIRKEKPNSVNELAKLLGRAQANVHKDVHYLAEMKILDLKRIKIPGKKSETVRPSCRWSGFDIDLAS
jgi:predicted transcriptional regulator